MIKERNKLLRSVLILFDAAIVSYSFFQSYYFSELSRDLYGIDKCTRVLPVVTLCLVAFLYTCGMYKSIRTKKIKGILWCLLKATLLSLVFMGGWLYFFRIQDISRAFIVSVFFVSFFYLAGTKIILMLILKYLRSKGYNFRNILLVGSGPRAMKFIKMVDEHREWGMRFEGIIDDVTENIGKIVCGHKILGTFKDLPDLLHDRTIDEVVFVVPRTWLPKVAKLILFCEVEGVKVNIAVDYFEIKYYKAKQSNLNGFPMLSLERTPDQYWHLCLKRLFDIALSSFLLVFLSPMFLLVAVLVKVTSRGPVLFNQTRSGLNGRPFTLLKFRTMVAGAESQLKELAGENEMEGPAFKMQDDPRITKIGNNLRKYSIDEFPQLWNVLKGDMSLVGPRPPIPNEVSEYDSWHRRRLRIRPGLTCLWQVSGRNEISDFDEWVDLDLEYIDNWSLLLDIKILFRTVPVVIFGVGAK